MIGAAFQAIGETRRKGSARINESKLTKGQIRKLNALRKSVGDALGEEAFGKWLAHQAEATAAPKPVPVAVRIQEVLSGYAAGRTFRLGNYGYTIQRVRGKGVSEFVVTKNEKPIG